MSNFIPALRFKWLTPLYDFFLKHTMPEKEIKEELLRSAGISGLVNLLDFGCGSATLTIMAKQTFPEIQIIGVDVDEDILKIARKKVSEKGLDIVLLNSGNGPLPFESNSFHYAFSCLVFHHLETVTKFTVLNELYRVMRPGGRLYIADFGRSKSRDQRILFNVIRSLDGYLPTEVNAQGRLPELISIAGFKDVGIIKFYRTIFGEVQIISAYKHN